MALALRFSLAAFFVLFAVQALAQEATIVGTVTDPTGAAVPNAPLPLRTPIPVWCRNLPTNGDGQYVAPDLLIGHYVVRAQRAAVSRPPSRKNLVLAVGDRTRIDFKLEVGSAQEQVTVEANAVAVQTDSGEVSNVINGQQMYQPWPPTAAACTRCSHLAPGASSIQSDRIVVYPGKRRQQCEHQRRARRP